MLGSSPILWSVEMPSKALSSLASQDFHERETAQSELLAWGRKQPEPAMAEFLRQSRISTDPEVRERCLKILRDLVSDEYLKEGEGFIGIGMKDDVANVPGDPKPRSVIRVTEVRPGTPGQVAGIQLNDLVAGLDGQTWHEGDASLLFREKIRAMKPNTKIELKILRDGGLIDLKLHLGRRPAMADNLFFNGQNIDPEAAERAAREAYFRSWMGRQKSQK